MVSTLYRSASLVPDYACMLLCRCCDPPPLPPSLPPSPPPSLPQGSFKDTTPDVLLAEVLSAVLARTGVDAADVGEVSGNAHRACCIGIRQ